MADKYVLKHEGIGDAEDKWKDAMIYLMHNKQHIVNTGHFRFFDSGDLQGIDMLNDINVVAWASPNIQFWLPTKEYKLIKDYKETLTTCHSTVGVAILNTSITIVFGFSILVLSKFIPTIYFGIFTGLAMLIAMILVLTLLPSLLLVFKPFGK